jgi:hypothetical protein
MQTILMLKSLRAFAGRFADVSVLVVQGRRGANVRAGTLEQLERLGAKFICAPGRANSFEWFNYSNKIAAVLVAEKVARTPTLAWIDSDVLFAAEPNGLLLNSTEDFAGRVEVLPPAVREGSNENIAYWRAICPLLGIEYSDLPWVERGDGTPRQKIYFNSGVFVWRRECGFAQKYSAGFTKLLNSRLAQATGVFFTADQVILGPVIVNNGMRWRQLGHREHLMAFPGLLDGPLRCPSLGDTAVIHYSASLNPPHRARFLARLRSENPGLASWLETEEVRIRLGAAPFSTRAVAATLKTWRKLQWELYSRSIKVISDR